MRQTFVVFVAGHDVSETVGLSRVSYNFGQQWCPAILSSSQAIQTSIIGCFFTQRKPSHGGVQLPRRVSREGHDVISQTAQLEISREGDLVYVVGVVSVSKLVRDIFFRGHRAGRIPARVLGRSADP